MSGIFIFFNGGTFATPVLPVGIFPAKYFTPPTNKTETFYAHILVLKLVNKQQDFISFVAGHSVLTFIKSHKLNPTYHFAFNIANNKLDEAIQLATTKFSLIENADSGIVANFESWNAKAIYFYDNNHNILEFIARCDLDNSTDKPFDISCIQSISEIGIVADLPMQTADELVAENDLCFFSKGVRSKDFVTVGNDNGLFIIVETNRKWYPTEQRAGKYFTRIKIATGGVTREITINEKYADR